jgi:hypothetical protein
VQQEGVATEAPASLTKRASRSLAGRVAPVVVLALGGLFVFGALNRLDAIYADDPGVFRSQQLAPKPIEVAHLTVVPVLDFLQDLFVRSDAGHSVCREVRLGRLCERRRSLHSDEAGRTKLERYDRRLFGRGTADVTVTSWQERPKRIVAVTVARFESDRAARRALRATHARRPVVVRRGVSRRPLARNAWLEGKRVLVGIAVSARTRRGAAKQLEASRREVRTYSAVSRVTLYEAIALGPLLLLLAALFSARVIATVAVALVAIATSLAGLAIAIVVLLLSIPVRVLRRRRKRARAPLRALVRPPLARLTPVHDLEATMKKLAAENRSVVLALAGLVGFGVAALTTSLFPESLVWGSLLVVALYSPKMVTSDPGKRLIMLGRKAVRVVLVVTFLAVLFGLAPIGLLSDTRLQIVVVAVGAIILLEHWRGLITETAVGYAKWYEDIDLRSSVFLVGVGMLTVGAAALFLASTGDRNLPAQAVEKLLGVAGLFVASSAAAHVRAARDAAARERARRRATPHVLYLRSFGDDKLRVVSPQVERRGLERLSWRRTELFEDVIARSLSSIGPVVAIARPGTGQRDLGAARDSIVVEDWLSAVKQYMSNAVLVAVVMGTSEGLVRELETLGELGLLDRVCVFVPPVNDDDISARMDVLAQQASFSDLWGKPTDDTEWRSGVVALTSFGGHRAALVAPKRTAIAYRAVGASLHT